MRLQRASYYLSLSKTGKATTKTIKQSYFDEILCRASSSITTKKVSEECADNSIWNTLSSKYNIRNMTMSEMKSLARELYEAGEISCLDLSIMTFNPPESPQWDELTEKYPQARFFSTITNQLGRRDWIKEYEARIAFKRKTGNTEFIFRDEKILSYFLRLER